jgi:hypothetical protein
MRNQMAAQYRVHDPQRSIDSAILDGQVDFGMHLRIRNEIQARLCITYR